MPRKSLRDFIQEAKIDEDPYVVDFEGEVGEVTFMDPGNLSVEDQFDLLESENPRKALQLFLGTEQYDRAWPAIKLMKISELGNLMTAVRQHFRDLRAERSANAS